MQGEALTFSDTVRNLTILMPLAVFVMYVILAILYESYVHPLTVLSTLPPALIGGLLTLLLFGEEASLYAFVGLFMLMGIVKKNGILIVDFARQRVEAGETAAKAIHDASMDRFRPDHHDDGGGGHRRASHRGGLRGRRGVSQTAGAGDSRRPDRLSIHHALYHTGDLPVPRTVPEESPGRRLHPSVQAVRRDQKSKRRVLWPGIRHQKA